MDDNMKKKVLDHWEESYVASRLEGATQEAAIEDATQCANFLIAIETKIQEAKE